MFLQETYEIEDCLYAPHLDGTETIHNVVGSPSISNGEFIGASTSSSYSSGYIGAFDNTDNWVMTVDVNWSSSGCALWVIKSDETSRDTNDVLLLRGTITPHENGVSGGNTTFSNTASTNTYYTVKYTKNGNQLTIERMNTSKTVTWNLLTSLSTLSVGVDAWNGTVKIKNIKVKAL